MGRPPSRRKNNARKSTGGIRRQIGSPRLRVTARKSTAPIYHPLRYPQAQEDSSSEDTMDEDEGGRNREDISEVYVPTIMRRRSGYPDPDPPYGGMPFSNASSNTNPQTSSLDLNMTQQQQDRVVVRIPQPRMSPFQPSFRRSESPRGTPPGQNEAAVASAVSAAVAALKTSASCTSPGRSGQSLVDEPENSIQISGDTVDEDVTSADSTNVIPEIPELCEPSSTSATTISAAFVPPPAVPGHSRWLLAQDNIAMQTPSNIEPYCSSDPTRPRKKKHFTPLPFPERSPPKLSRNSSSLQNPFFTIDDPPLNTSLSKDPQSGDINTKKIKKAFRNFQSIRRLVTDSGVCSHFNGFVQLNAVEQMLIKCYNRVKKISKSDEGSHKSSNPPVIVLDDSSDVVRCDPVKQTSSFDDDGEDDIDTISIQVSPPTLSSDANVEKTNAGGDSIMSALDTTGESSEIPQTSSNSTTSILVGGKNVAKKNASVVCSPSLQIFKSSRGKRFSTGSSRMNSSTVGHHVDEVINTVIKDEQQSRPAMAGSSSSSPSVMPNADILSQFSETHRRTLNRLVHMGFGSKDGDNFDQLVKIVHEKNGNLDACIDKLTNYTS